MRATLPPPTQNTVRLPVRKLRQVGYDSAIIMRPDHWWGALLAYLSGIRQRVGYSEPGSRPF
ncbi:MAG: hypothetical protein OXG68_02625 [Chloroflexi bacterium]|nr:hypothetical protein [Chloroflexota bacterium]